MSAVVLVVATTIIPKTFQEQTNFFEKINICFLYEERDGEAQEEEEEEAKKSCTSKFLDVVVAFLFETFRTLKGGRR